MFCLVEERRGGGQCSVWLRSGDKENNVLFG